MSPLLCSGLATPVVAQGGIGQGWTTASDLPLGRPTGRTRSPPDRPTPPRLPPPVGRHRSAWLQGPTAAGVRPTCGCREPAGRDGVEFFTGLLLVDRKEIHDRPAGIGPGDRDTLVRLFNNVPAEDRAPELSQSGRVGGINADVGEQTGHRPTVANGRLTPSDQAASIYPRGRLAKKASASGWFSKKIRMLVSRSSRSVSTTHTW